MKKQFAGLLKDVGFISSSHPKDEMANVNSTNLKLVKAVLCAGLYPNVIKIEQKKPGGYEICCVLAFCGIIMLPVYSRACYWAPQLFSVIRF